MRIRPPFAYAGGKFYALGDLLPIIHAIPHRVYVEPFGGSGVVLLNKTPSPVEVFNDANPLLVNCLRVIAEPETFRRLVIRLALLPYSRRLYEQFRRAMGEEADPVDRAAMWFYVVSPSFSGIAGGSWRFVVGESTRRMAHTVSTYLSAVENLEAVHHRLRGVRITCLDFEEVMEAYDSEETLFFVDPPYIGLDYYSSPFPLSEHRRLVRTLLRLRGSWVMTCYDHPVYLPLEQVAEKRTRRLALFMVGRTRVIARSIAMGRLGDGFQERVGGYRRETIFIRRSGIQRVKPDRLL